MEQYNNVFSSNDISYFLNLPEVLKAKNQIDTKNNGSVYFNVSLPDTIKDIINDKMGVNLFNIAKIPMRWIKGDTLPHIDRGIRDFDNTYLIYLNNSNGELVIDDINYPIIEGFGYKFPEKLSHKTINTGSEPRLLLGPMSEEGFSVGGFSLNGNGGTSVYIRDNLGEPEFTYNYIDWYTIFFPCAVANNDTSTGYFKVEFISDITLSDTNKFFICSSNYIQFGSESLKNDGTRPVINVPVDNYDGLIQNGTNVSDGQNNIYVFNLEINAIEYNCQIGAGWIGKKYFGRNGINNYIVNCSSNGNMPGGANGSGGIVGSYAGSFNGSLTIVGCYSSGSMGESDGGIVGSYAGNNTGSVICEQCYSTGIIGNFAGGIFGDYAGDSGNASAIKCYSTGLIGENAGGIFGRFAGNDGNASATKCYSIATINTDGGGIYGIGAGSNGGTSSATNCYSKGIITTVGNGIYGTGKVNENITNCYSANGTWSTATANTLLTGTPSPTIGTTWVATTINQPYELNGIGYTPYNINNIDLLIRPNLNQSYSQTINAGNSTSNAIILGKNYTILSVSATSITINFTNGSITSGISTPSNIYTIYIRNNGSYHITTVILTVTTTGPIPCLLEDTMVLTPNGYLNITELSEDDEVITSSSKIVKITKIFTTIAQGDEHTYPCVIPKNGISNNYPPSELKISQNHLIRYYNQWIRPKDYFPIDTSYKIMKYYHIQLENYLTDDLIINDGVVVESYSINNEETEPRFINRFRKSN